MKRLACIGGGIVAAALAVSLGAAAREIARQSSLDEARPADVIVVLGAAEYRGRPSPVLRGRLDHAYDLYRRGLAPRILTTGGSGGDPDYTESEVGRAYLLGRGVPSDAIVVER
ncbi:MAG: YdcF family protein, partial [Acidobacteria bacterium]|nr:YdcF family protein [Acidobacteriota bacterium]